MLFYCATLKDGHLWWDDSAKYLIQAGDMASGRLTTDTCHLYNPLNPYDGPEIYPPGYPLALAPVYKARGLDFKAFKIENIVFFVLFLYVVFLYFEKTLSYRRRLLLIAALGFNPFLWGFKDAVYADYLFCLLQYLSFYLYEKSDGGDGPLLPVLAGLTAYAAYSVRVAGLFMPAAIGLYALITRTPFKKKNVLFMLAFALPAAVQSLFYSTGGYRNYFLSGLSGSHLNILGDFLRSFLTVWSLGGTEAAAFNALSLVAGAAALAAFLYSYAGALRRGPGPMEVYFPFYIFAVCVYGGGDGMRYIFPLLPYYAALALKCDISVPGLRRARFAAPAVLAVLLGVLYAGDYFKFLDYRPMREGMFKKESVQLFDFVRGTVRPEEAVVFLRPRAMCLFTGKRSTIYPASEDDRQWLGYFKSVNARYIVLGRVFNEDMHYVAGFLERNRKLAEKVYENPDFKVFRLKV